MNNKRKSKNKKNKKTLKYFNLKTKKGDIINHNNINNNQIKNKTKSLKEKLISNENDLIDITYQELDGKMKKEKTYCFCNYISYGNMVKCDNPDCIIQWFHFLLLFK